MIEGIEVMSHILFQRVAESISWRRLYAVRAGYQIRCSLQMQTAERLRDLERSNNVRIMIIGVHLTGISPDDINGCWMQRILLPAALQTHPGTGKPLVQWEHCPLRPSERAAGGRRGGAAPADPHHALPVLQKISSGLV